MLLPKTLLALWGNHRTPKPHEPLSLFAVVKSIVHSVKIIFDNLGLQVKRYKLEEVQGKYYQMDIRELLECHHVVWLNVPGKRPIAKKMVVEKFKQVYFW